jgi:hypothetical protein
MDMQTTQAYLHPQQRPHLLGTTTTEPQAQPVINMLLKDNAMD